MEDKSLHRKILFSSLAGIILFTGLFVLGLNSNYEDVVVLPAVLIAFSLISILTSYAIKYQNKKWLRKSAKFSSFLLPVFIVPVVFIGYYNDGISNLLLAIIIISVILTFFTLINLFIYSDAPSLTGVILLILLFITGLFMKRQHWPLAGMTITVFTLLISAGSFMFGLRCLFLEGKMTYFRNVTFFGSIFMSIAFMGQLFKIQHWFGAGPLAIVGFAGLILGSIYVLITLHSSGYIDWQPLHKKVLRKILIPWTFIFFMYISRYMVPELNTLIWTPDVTRKKLSNYGFTMKDYSVEEKNGFKMH
jgi:hypothetical protein